MTKHSEMQKFIRAYRDEKNVHEVDMHDVAKWAISKGWKVPMPSDPVDILAKQFSQAAREEVRYDKSTNRSYRANHSYVETKGGKQLHFWVDIDDEQVTAFKFRKSMVSRREQMVGDATQLSLDLDHWNSIRPIEDYIELDMDLNPDVEWRKNSMDEKDIKKA